MFVNYNDCILSLSSTIAAFLGVKSTYPSHPSLDKIIQAQKPQKIILCLIDAMGAELIKRKLSADSFMKEHLLEVTQSVFPPTTTAATTSILNAKAPNENAWLGWMQYFKEVDDFLIPFLNKSYYSKKDYGQNFVADLIPVTSFLDLPKTHDIFPKFKKDGAKTIEEFVERIVTDSYDDDRFIYAYWDEYDDMMHHLGVDHEKCDAYLKKIDRLFKEAMPRLSPDCLLIVTADHGQIDLEEEIDFAKSDLAEYLIRPLANEGRASVFYVRDDQKEAFETKFKELYQDDFILLNQEQVLSSKLFGNGQDHKRLLDFIGDFVAIAKGKKQFVYQKDQKSNKMIGAHAGLSKEELLVPIIAYHN